MHTLPLLHLAYKPMASINLANVTSPGLHVLQGHVLFTRQAGALNPCPAIDFTGGFNGFFAAAYGVASVQAKFGAPFSMPPHCS